MEQVFQQPAVLNDHVSDMRRGANWFFWVSILSVINSLLVTYSGTANFIFGLGATRWIDEALRANSLSAVTVSGMLLGLAVAGLFAVFGYFGRLGNDKAYVLGIFLYVVDAMIVLGFKDFFSFGFHLLALFFLFKGLFASRRRFDPSV
jgi:hypothetical protein